MKKRIPRKNNLSSTIFHKPTNTILCMTRRIQRFHGNISNFEALSIGWGLRDAFTVFAAYYRFILEFGGEGLLRDRQFLYPPKQ
jgi:hypothetical protein